MSDKLFEDASLATEIEITAANEANRKYGRVTHDNNHLLAGTLGEAILDTEEKLVEAKKENEKLLDRAMVDQVTGLPNEKAFEDMIQGLEGRWQRDGLWGTFIVADLTGLHVANDKHGRSAGGDDYLKAVGAALAEASRTSDRYFRMGTSADEFVLYLPDIKDKKLVDVILNRVDGSLQIAQNEYQAQYPGIQFGLSYAASSFDKNVSPRDAITKAMNALGKAKESKNGERVGTVGRQFVE